MKHFLIPFLILFVSLLVSAQNKPSSDQIRQQMARIRQSTNWSDPAAAKKANEEIKKLASQLNGGNPAFSFQNSDTQKQNTTNTPYEVKSAITQTNIVAIADRFFKRSYKVLDAVSKSKFDQDYKIAEKEKFSFTAVRKLTSTGAALITFGNDHLIACVYLSASVKAFPTDTLCINNFGAYLRIIDSTKISVPVLLYANKLFSSSPVILTQLGNSYFELGDFVKAEFYYKQAIKINPDFGQAHSALCDLYIKQNRLQDAILELFAGVKGMGASYSQASNNYSYLQQQSEKSGGKDNSSSKQDILDQTKKQLDPSEALAPLVPDDNRVKMPNFPNCNKVEDWLEGGGYSSAVMSYKSFHSYLMSFSNQFLQVHQQAPAIPAGAVLRDYPNERFALDCITEMFAKYSEQENKKYQKSIDEITQRVNDAKELYIKKYGEYAKEYASCVEGCSNEYCLNECHRKYCSMECPNANNYNDKLRQGYKDYRSEFTALVGKQTKLLDDLYAFSNPWLAKISSPYWSKIYAYEIKRVALGIVGNCYGSYPQPFQGLAHNDCGEDCSIYANPYPEKPDEVNKKDPKENECPEDSKHILHLFFCEASLTCEYWEIGCTEGVSASVRRNFGKHKSTTVFLGAGVEAGLGAVGASAKFGGQVTVGDDGSVDGGFRGSVSGDLPVRNKGYNGTESEFTLTAFGGYNSESYKVSSTGYGKEGE